MEINDIWTKVFSSGQLVYLCFMRKGNSDHFGEKKLSEQFKIFSTIKLYNMSTQKHP